jgi:hypothetical protein
MKTFGNAMLLMLSLNLAFQTEGLRLTWHGINHVVDDAQEDESKYTLVLKDESELNQTAQLFDDCKVYRSFGPDGTTFCNPLILQP